MQSLKIHAFVQTTVRLSGKSVATPKVRLGPPWSLPTSHRDLTFSSSGRGGTAVRFLVGWGPRRSTTRSTIVMNHSDKFRKILVVVGAILFMASNAFATRSREYLETIEIDDFCIAHPKNHQGFWVAHIKDPAGFYHTVTVGSHIGKNYGVITKITNDTVEVIELILEEPSGRWIERPLTLKVWRDPLQPCQTQRSIGRGKLRHAN